MDELKVFSFEDTLKRPGLSDRIHKFMFQERIQITNLELFFRLKLL